MIKINEQKMRETSDLMANLRQRNISLREQLSTLYDNIASALQCESGKEVKFVGKEDLIKPLENMDKVLEHMSDTLKIMIGQSSDAAYPPGVYYDKVFDEYDKLIRSIQNLEQKTED